MITNRILRYWGCLLALSLFVNQLIAQEFFPVHGKVIDGATRHIEIPNINHFATQGATGGPVSIVIPTWCAKSSSIRVPSIGGAVKKGGRASEFELAIQWLIGTRIIPAEVKAEVNVKSKSLRTFVEKNPSLRGLRLSMLPAKEQDWMSNRPLYAPACWLKE